MSMGKFHFQKNVLEAACWCESCGKETPHRIDAGRRGPCLNPTHGRQGKLIEIGDPLPEQQSMFEEPRQKWSDKG